MRLTWGRSGDDSGWTGLSTPLTGNFHKEVETSRWSRELSP